MVYYRKYRPQNISQLDTDSVREKLTGVLSQKSVPHAFLFTGPKGAGKTSAARIVAKVINCEARNVILSESEGSHKKRKDSSAKPQNDNINIEPCNKCEQCISITNGTNLDTLEIDGASNRGIDEIRDLREKVRLSPVSAEKKVYIIDEVHMLTSEAFNALLKTIEEPPSHVVFILCTTELHKVPITIVSRCFHVNFTKGSKAELTTSLERMVKGEKIDIEKDALAVIAEFAGGGFRDAAKILEEVFLASNGKKITKEFVESSYHIADISVHIDTLLDQLVKKDSKASLLLIEEMAKEGMDIQFLIATLIEKLHSILLSKIGVSKEVAEYNFSLKELSELTDLLTKAYAAGKYAVLGQLPLELAVIEWGNNPVIPNSFRDPVREGSTEMRKLGQHDNKTSPSLATRSNDELWKNLIEKVKEKNHSLAGVLRGCSLSSYNEKELVIEAKYKFHKEKLEEKDGIELLKNAIKELTGKNLVVSIVQS